MRFFNFKSKEKKPSAITSEGTVHEQAEEKPAETSPFSADELLDSLRVNEYLSESQLNFVSLIISSLYYTEKDDNDNITKIEIGESTNPDILQQALKNTIIGNGSFTELIQDWMSKVANNQIILYATGKYKFEDLQELLNNNVITKENGNSLLEALNDSYYGTWKWSANRDTKNALSELNRTIFCNSFKELNEQVYKDVFLTNDFYKEKLDILDEEGNLKQNETNAAQQIENAIVDARMNPLQAHSSLPSTATFRATSERSTNANQKEAPEKHDPAPHSEKEARFYPMNGWARGDQIPILIAKGNKLYKAFGGAALAIPIAEIKDGKIYRCNTPGAGLVVASTDGNTVGKGYTKMLWLKLQGNQVIESPGGGTAAPFIEGENCTKEQLAMAAAILKLGYD